MFELRKKCLKLIWIAERPFLPLTVFSELFKALTPYLNIFMTAEILDELTGAMDWNRLIRLVVITLSANIAISLTSMFLVKYTDESNERLKLKEKQWMNEKFYLMDYRYIEDHQIEKMRRKIHTSSWINYHGIWHFINSIRAYAAAISKILLSASLSIKLFTELSNISGVALGYFIIIFLLLMTLAWGIVKSRKESALSKELSDNMLMFNRISRGYDIYSTGKDCRIYKIDEMIIEEDEYRVSLNQNGFARHAKTNFRYDLPGIILRHLSKGTIYYFIIMYAIRGLIGLGSLVKYVALIEKFVFNVKFLSDYIIQDRDNTPFLKQYIEFMELPSKMYQGRLPVEKRTDNEFFIEFRNVTFKYPETEEYVLKNASFKLTLGETMAIVGMNGSGKTTLIKLMCRLYDPTEGEILLNRIDIRKYDYLEYLSLFSVVFQDFKLFSLTLGENIAASVDYDDSKAEECINEAGFGERYESLSNGLNTFIYKDFESEGVEISGGEAQKIAIARALYKNAPFVILDEPTAALDPIAEFDIYSRFNELVKDKTAIYISHRLSSCRFCDHIMVLDEGEIVQEGHHDVLIKEDNGKYAELWNAQAKYYV